MNVGLLYDPLTGTYIAVPPRCQWPEGASAMRFGFSAAGGPPTLYDIKREDAPGCSGPFCRVCAGMEDEDE